MQGQNEAHLNGWNLFARVYWMLFGNVLLFFLLVYIFQNATGFPSWMDAVYGLAAGFLLLVRYIDIRYLNGLTGEGKPASMRDFRRYAMLVAAVASGGWIVAHVLRHLLA